MLKYDEFKSRVEKEFLSYMSEKYQNMKLEIRSVEKVNQRLDGLTLKSQESMVSPTMNLNAMYDSYLKNEDFQETLADAAKLMEGAFEEKDRVATLNFDDAKNNIVFQFINTAQNEKMLKDMPHREFQDLSLIYRWIVKMDQEGIQSTMIHNSLAKQLGFKEEELFKLAEENTRRILPPKISNMNDMLREMLRSRGMEEEMIERMMPEIPEDNTMWVITNSRGINGAVSMFYEDKLHELAEEVGSDLYILPSSVHEVIAVPDSLGDPNELAQMVTEVNMGQVAVNERLSNQIYFYDKDARELTLATDTPNKSLDRGMDEEELPYNPNLFPIDLEPEMGMEPEM